MRLATWGIAVAVVGALSACRPFRASTGDGGPAEDPGGETADAAGGNVGPIADNDADITRYPDEKAVDHVLGVTRLAASNARTQAGASLGSVVAALPQGTSVDKVAVRRGWFLVVFIDPKDPGAGRRLLGWLDPTDFVPPTGKLPAVHCEMPKVPVVVAGKWTCAVPAPTAPPTGPTVPPTVPTVPSLPEAGPAPKPSRPLDVKQQGGACPGGYARCSALCRLQCGKDADCGLATAHCQAGFCLGPGAQPCGS
jgi:hypothetical protein